MDQSEEHDRSQDFAALAELAEVFAALVQAMHDEQRVALSPARVVDVAARCMPRSQHVALTAVTDDDVHTVAATSEVPGRIADIRTSTDQGPVLDVLETNDLVASGDIAGDPRWPRFGSLVTDTTGVRSIVSYRLYLSPHHRAALTFYSDWPHAFDEVSIATGAIFAAYASLTLTSELVLTERVPARRSQDVHREIGVAIGILMATADLTTQSAYRHLHRASHDLRQSLPVLAHHVVQHRRLPEVPTA